MANEANDFNINLGDTIYSDSEVGGAPVARTVEREVGRSTGSGSRFPRSEGSVRSAGLYSHWDDHEFINDFSRAEHGGADLRGGRQGVHRLRAGREAVCERALSDVPLGQEPRALLPRRALVPQRQGNSGMRRRSRPDGAASGARCVLDPRARSEEPGGAGMSRRDQRPVADDARRASVRGVHESDQGVDGDVEGHRQRGADPAVLRAPVRPLGGIRGRARAAPPLPAGERAATSSSSPPTRTRTSSTRCGTGRSAARPRERASGRSSPVPVATNSFAKEIDGYLGQKGAGTAIGALFFKPPPPNGMGMRCAALDTYSYAEVSVTREAPHRRDEGRQGPAGARGDGRRLRPARPDRPLTTSGRRADYPHGGRP